MRAYCLLKPLKICLIIILSLSLDPSTHIGFYCRYSSVQSCRHVVFVCPFLGKVYRRSNHRGPRAAGCSFIEWLFEYTSHTIGSCWVPSDAPTLLLVDSDFISSYFTHLTLSVRRFPTNLMRLVLKLYYSFCNQHFWL